MKSRAHGGELHEELEQRIRDHRSRRKGVRRKALQQLGEIILKRADDRALLEFTPEVWLRQIEDLLLFVSQRVDGEVLVDVGEPREAGAGRGERTLVTTCMADQPFVVDTLRLTFERLGIEVLNQINVIVPTLRTRSGKLRGFDWESDAHRLESITVFELAPIEKAKDRRALQREIMARLLLARAVATDFRRMLREIKTVITEYESLEGGGQVDDRELQEVTEFLGWLLDENFVFMGVAVVPVGRGQADGERLGVFRFGDRVMGSRDTEGKAFLKSYRNPSQMILVHKTAEESQVHRAGKIDEILLRRLDDRGRCVATVIVHGLFTFRAVHTQGASVPLLRRKLLDVLAMEEVVEGTYNYKSVVNAFNSLPVEYLFTATPEDIRIVVRRALVAERALRVEVHLSLSRARRSGFLFVVMPRQHFSDQVRLRIQQALFDVLGVNYCDHRVFIGNYGVAVLHFYFTSEGDFPDIEPGEFEAWVLDLARSWQERFRDALLETLSREEALELYRRYSEAFSERYQVSTSGAQAVSDCIRLESIRERGGLAFDVYRDAEDEEQQTAKLRIYEDTNLYLTDVLPILDNFGLTVINSFTNRVRCMGDRPRFMDTFRFRVPDSELESLLSEKDNLISALSDVFEGRMANDRLNRVLLPSRLMPRQVDLIRSYQGYSRQLGSVFTSDTIWQALVAHADLVRMIVEWFETRFGPDGKGKIASRPSPARLKRSARLAEEIYHRIDGIQSYNEDRILRNLADLVAATLRTSYFQGRAHFAHKFDCAAVSGMEEPKPWREIFVHHAAMEGVHLRGGSVARGGLRFSDRPVDYRTEILGLMTTQMEKNVVIVPVGAKGGFVVRKPASDSKERRAQGDAMYEIFISALLDVTDNIIDGNVMPPQDVVCYDAPDPYLVVAADKGTAHLSDTANAISEARGFWLGDAFASGGSNGYDHKAVGITARGTWVCIRHHFAEMGIDPAKDEFTAVGIGDMGGDVFGNGMLEHKTTLLLAAFNHLHIFLDPDPDPKISYGERRRLFRSAQGGWDAYDSSKISKGGGVYPRSAKSIPLSVPARQMLGVAASELTPSEVIRAILRTEAELLYNGGIGTYVKASTEPDSAAQDPGNAAVRVDANELRAKVVGEGGNLGFTTQGHIEYSRRGGRINTDFIDNAGGVNMSDHEVNLKILLKGAMQDRKVSLSARNRLLAELEPAVTEEVLVANGSQALLLSLDERRSRAELASFDRLVDEVCRREGLKRGDLGLPPVKEIDGRIKAGEGLCRPELAVLSSHVKMIVYARLLGDERVDIEGLRPYLHNYFPDRIKARYSKQIDEHPLGREIALTRMTNRIVDQAGATFFSDMAIDAGAGLLDAVMAYSLASRAAGTWGLKDEILDPATRVTAEVRYGALLQVESALRAASLHLLESWTPDHIQTVLRDTASFARPLKSLAKDFLEHLDPISHSTATAIKGELEAEGFSAALATRVAVTRYLPYGLVVLDLAEREGRPVRDVARDYFSLGRASNIFAAVETLDSSKAEGYYESLARKTQRQELFALLSQLVLRLGTQKGSAEERLESLGPGQEALAMLGKIDPEELGAAALMVTTERIRSALR